MNPRIHPSSERGIAMITSLMMMLLISALLVGFTAVVMSDQRHRFIDKDRSQAFYAATAGLEKLTADLGNLFFVNVAPSASQVQALTSNPPTITGVTFTKGNNASGYEISAAAPTNTVISAGPYQGLIALMTEYTMDVTARTVAEGEVHLQRKAEAVAIPLFQFGIFSDPDLSFFAGPNFDFGGRVHTNGNLFLSEGPGNTLTLRDKVTAVGEVIRQRLANNATITQASAHDGTVRVATATNVFRNLQPTEGSKVDDVNSANNEPTWHNMSLSAYNGYIRNGRTGAKALNLPLVTIGGANTDLVRRPALNEDTNNPTLFGQRYFPRVGIRILLSDTAADITNLPGVTNTPPVQLDGNWRAAPPNNGTAYNGGAGVNATHPPLSRTDALTTGTVVTGAAIAAGTNKTIPIPGLPNAWKIQTAAPLALNQITVSKTVAGVTTNQVYTCAGKSASTFTACTGQAAFVQMALANTPTVSATINTVDGPITVSTPLAATVNAGAGPFTITVGADQTLKFAPNTFWVNNRLITCGGFDANNLRNCTIPAVVNNNDIVTTAFRQPAGTVTLGGFIKVERQGTNGVWSDVTMEWLNYGIGAPNQAGTICADPTPNAIIRLQRLRDNNWASCTYPDTANPNNVLSTDYWPNVLFDTREALFRDTSPGANVPLGGIMGFVTLDVGNLTRWIQGVGAYAAGTGTNTISTNGYAVYFSDRRSNRNGSNQETGEYGFEDIVNANIPAGTPNNALEAGEDFNANNTLETYGEFPSFNGVLNAVPYPAPYDNSIRPWTMVTPAEARLHRVLHFRRALKLMNGSLGNIITPGLTVVAENPVYIQGDYNANAAGFGDPHAATSVVGDAVTLLSNNWTDANSFNNPYDPNSRLRNGDTWYRVAIIGGKGPSFPWVNGQPSDFGTDGGTHNFLRYLEGGGNNLNYRGSIASFYYSRQATGTYKCCTTVYAPPTRGYNFDIEFLTPALLPPLTPVFRDLNTIGFSQETRPGK